jgi:hypothetical protein
MFELLQVTSDLILNDFSDLPKNRWKAQRLRHRQNFDLMFIHSSTFEKLVPRDTENDTIGCGL